MLRAAFFRATLIGLAAFGVTTTTARVAHAEELSFSRAIKIAKQRAPEIKAARAAVDSAAGQIDVARSQYFPTLTATGTAFESASGDTTAIIPPRTTPTSIITYTTAGIAAGALRWTVLDFGKTSNAVQSAELIRDMTAAQAVDVETTLLTSVANGYLDVVYGEKIRDIQRSIVDERERIIQIVKGLVKQGLAPAVDEMRAHSRVEAARRDLETFEATLTDARVGLLAFLGLDPKSTPTFSAPHFPRVRSDGDGAMQDAEQKAPGVQAARANAASEEAQVDAARARYYPSLALNGDASYRTSRIDVFDQWLPTRVATGTVLLTVPIYDPSIAPKLDSAKADAMKAEASYDQTKRDARTEAARAAAGLTTADRVLEHAKKAAESSAAVLAVIRARYIQGLSSILDLIDAEGADADAQLASARAERALDGGSVRLFAATGRASKLAEAP